MPDWLTVIVVLLALVGLGFLAWLAGHVVGKAIEARDSIRSLECRLQALIEGNVRDEERRWTRLRRQDELTAKVERLEAGLVESGKLGAHHADILGKLTGDVRELQRLNRMVEGWAAPVPVAPEATPPSPPPPADAPTTVAPEPARELGPQDLPEAFGAAPIPTRRLKG